MNIKKGSTITMSAVLAFTLSAPAYAASDITVPAVDSATVATPSVPAAPVIPSTPSSPSSSSSSSSGSSTTTRSNTPSMSDQLVDVAGFDSAKQFTGYFANLKRAVANGNRDAVAKRVSYPLAVNLANGTRRSILNEKQFKNEYTSIMTSGVRQALSRQNVNEVFINYRGVSVGNGTMWIGVIDGKPGIYAINL